MISELSDIHPHVTEYVSDLVNQEGLTDACAEPLVASKPIPVHQLRMFPNGTWDAAAPLAGLAYPYYDGESLHSVIRIQLERGVDIHSHEILDGSSHTALCQALETALSIGDLREDDCRLRIISVPGHFSAFWLEGAYDTFCHLDDGRVMSGPEFVGLIDGDLSLYADGIRALMAEGSQD